MLIHPERSDKGLQQCQMVRKSQNHNRDNTLIYILSSKDCIATLLLVVFGARYEWVATAPRLRAILL